MERDLEDLMRLAYMAAIKQQQGGRSVQIHLGSDVLERLRKAHEDIIARPPWLPGAVTAFGFPVVLDESRPDAVSVHSVEVIA